jgi:hypothetical protein
LTKIKEHAQITNTRAGQCPDTGPGPGDRVNLFSEAYFCSRMVRRNVEAV